MPDAYEIIVPAAEVTLDGNRNGLVLADVTSQLDRTVVTHLQVLPGEGGEATWFPAADPASYEGAAGATQKVRIPVSVPADVPVGTTTFTLRAYAEDAPTADWTVSAPVQVAIPEVEKKSGVPAWLLAVAALVVLALIGGIAWVVFGSDDDVAVPALVGLTAEQALEAAGGVDVAFVSATPVTGTAGTGTSGTGSGTGRCVLFQYRPAGTFDDPVQMPDDAGIIAATVPCPSKALTPDRVRIDTEVTLDDGTAASYANFCSVGALDQFCDVIEEAIDEEEGDGAGEEFVTSEALAGLLRPQEALFRTAHSELVVPDLEGLEADGAQALLDLMDLDLHVKEVLAPATTATTTTPAPGTPVLGTTVLFGRPCELIITQDPAPGTDPDTVDGGTVEVIARQSTCTFPVFEILPNIVVTDAGG